MSRLDEIEDRLSKATPGAWDSGVLIEEMEGDYCVWKRTEPEKQREFLGNVGSLVQPVIPKGVSPIYFDAEKHDAEFIAHAKQDIPWLLARVRALEAGLELAVIDLETLLAVHGHYISLTARAALDLRIKELRAALAADA